MFDLLFWELEGPKLSVSPPDVSAHLEMRKIRKMNKNPKSIHSIVDFDPFNNLTINVALRVWYCIYAFVRNGCLRQICRRIGTNKLRKSCIVLSL